MILLDSLFGVDRCWNLLTALCRRERRDRSNKVGEERKEGGQSV